MYAPARYRQCDDCQGVGSLDGFDGREEEMSRHVRHRLTVLGGLPLARARRGVEGLVSSLAQFLHVLRDECAEVRVQFDPDG